VRRPGVVPNPRNSTGFGLEWGQRTYVAGIVNVTPDSFSDGGEYYDPEAAISHAHELVKLGADIIDVGGESTRPNAPPVTEREELDRVLPVITGLAEHLTVPISVDTMKARVADEALAAGARIVNDVSGTLHDPDIVAVAANHRAGLIIVHNEELTDRDLVTQITSFWSRIVDRALEAGVLRENLLLDPGLGFRKGTKVNIELLRRLGELVRAVPLPVMLGHSRKSTIAHLFGDSIAERDLGTAVLSGAAVQHNVDVLRVHDVRSTRTVISGVDRLYREGGTSSVVRTGINHTDTIRLEGIACFAYHGMLDEERRRGQSFVVDVELGLSLERAGISDELNQTLDYGAIYRLIHETVAGGQYHLIETVADRVAQAVLAEHASVLHYVEVTVHKPAAPLPGALEDVSVTIRRGSWW